MFLGIQDFYFAQISSKFRLNFAQIQPNRTNFVQKFLPGNAVASPAPTALYSAH